MALQLTIQKGGKTFENAYIKIAKFSGDKNSVTIEVVAYKEKGGARIAQLHNINTEFVNDLESLDNTLSRGYKFLKTQDFFKNAINV